MFNFPLTWDKFQTSLIQRNSLPRPSECRRQKKVEIYCIWVHPLLQSKVACGSLYWSQSLWTESRCWLSKSVLKDREKKNKKERKEKQVTTTDLVMFEGPSPVTEVVEDVWSMCPCLWGWQGCMLVPSNRARSCCQAESVQYHVASVCHAGCTSAFARRLWRIVFGGGTWNHLKQD